MLYLICATCTQKGRFETYEAWKKHLFTFEHQSNTRKELHKWSNYEDDKSIVVDQVPLKFSSDQSINNYEILFWYFSQFSLVVELYMRPEEEFCIIQVESKDTVTNLLTFEHCIPNFHSKISPVRKSDWKRPILQVLSSSKRKLNGQSYREDCEEPSSKHIRERSKFPSENSDLEVVECYDYGYWKQEEKEIRNGKREESDHKSVKGLREDSNKTSMSKSGSLVDVGDIIVERLESRIKRKTELTEKCKGLLKRMADTSISCPNFDRQLLFILENYPIPREHVESQLLFYQLLSCCLEPYLKEIGGAVIRLTNGSVPVGFRDKKPCNLKIYCHINIDAVTENGTKDAKSGLYDHCSNLFNILTSKVKFLKSISCYGEGENRQKNEHFPYQKILCNGTVQSQEVKCLITITTDQIRTYAKLSWHRLLSFYCDLDPFIPAFLNLVNFWNDSVGLKFSSSILTTLAVVFLIKSSILPTPAHLQNSMCSFGHFINGWNVEFLKNKNIVLQSGVCKAGTTTVGGKHLMYLLAEFFEYILSLDICDYVISTSTCVMLPKCNFEPKNMRNLPPHLHHVNTQCSLDVRHLLVIQHPFILNYNLAYKHLNSCGKKQVKGYRIEEMWIKLLEACKQSRRKEMKPSEKISASSQDVRITDIFTVSLDSFTIDYISKMMLYRQFKKSLPVKYFSMCSDFSSKFDEAFVGLDVPYLKMRKELLWLGFFMDMWTGLFDALFLNHQLYKMDSNSVATDLTRYIDSLKRATSLQNPWNLNGQVNLKQKIMSIPVGSCMISKEYNLKATKCIHDSRNSCFSKISKLEDQSRINPLEVELKTSNEVQNKIKLKNLTTLNSKVQRIKKFKISVEGRFWADRNQECQGSYRYLFAGKQPGGMTIQLQATMNTIINRTSKSYTMYRLREWLQQYEN